MPLSLGYLAVSVKSKEQGFGFMCERYAPGIYLTDLICWYISCLHNSSRIQSFKKQRFLFKHFRYIRPCQWNPDKNIFFWNLQISSIFRKYWSGCQIYRFIGFPELYWNHETWNILVIIFAFCQKLTCMTTKFKCVRLICQLQPQTDICLVPTQSLEWEQDKGVEN